jgi:GTPase Era involved in 16S rRNA processing
MREIGIDRPRFDVKVSNEVFTLYFIPNLARKKYIDFWHRVEQMMEALKIKNKKERQQAVDSLSSDDESDLLKEIIEVTLEANNISYDEDWWESHTDAEMQLEFVRSVLEGSDSGKKKVLQALKA